jgi:hypothetical protein
VSAGVADTAAVAVSAGAADSAATAIYIFYAHCTYQT